MCLYIGRTEGYTLKKDLICYKQIFWDDKERYRTPCQSWPVKLDSTLIPDESKPQIEDYGFKWELGGGVIHAYLKINSGSNIYKAIIPKGTKVWIQDDLTEIAAEKLELTSEKVNCPAKSDLTEFIENLGTLDFYLKTGEKKKIQDNPKPEDVKGIVLESGKIVSLNFYGSERFFEKKLTGFTGKTYSDLDKAFLDNSGEKNTEDLKELLLQSSNLLVIEKCKQNEYLPGMGELKEAFLSLLQINLGREFLGLEPIPLTWYWSSSIRDEESVWICNSDGYRDWRIWYRYCYGWRYRILPFLKNNKENH